MELFLLAHEKYHEWGAFGKCTSLYEFVSSSIGTGLTNTTDTDTSDSMGQETAAQNLDDDMLSSLDEALQRHTDMASGASVLG